MPNRNLLLAGAALFGLIAAPAAGRVASLSAADGETVAAGAKLAFLSNSDYARSITGRGR